MESTKRPGRRRDQAWSEVNVADDGYVYCLRCESVIHKLGYTHVDRVKRHLRDMCAKRPRQEVVTSYFPPNIDATTQRQINKQFELCPFCPGMAFYKAQHAACTAVFRLLHPTVTIPSQHLLRGRLLDECYEDSITQMRGVLARRHCSFVTDG
ncbi:hypothetical protein PF005_g1050 [Phytophthora fragariae]|uniref:BED-type domain-containing protein n=1 Tax=Phytophthora fragariae TaxID=53985 RepID=A0A6A3FT77_9STRA|nr:hypothetical protein PF003_g13403 [Phytophthora fragariae]KAE8949354.1 hypothetical protein PF009_g1107 [Phytophthora fragariae]KAE9139670.1 hypothetical protein PF007_g956 [Phytophthora fragariae]KAE9155129.1 hypothetical protein PF006_g895 [Phytophthora fragariae]KAE9236446.1 hypothetical protein PF005_g1050 [Phytophthora fragariae]